MEENNSGSHMKFQDSQIIPSVTVQIPMPPGAAIPAQANPPQNPPAQAPADSSNSTR